MKKLLSYDDMNPLHRMPESDCSVSDQKHQPPKQPDIQRRGARILKDNLLADRGKS